MKVTYDVMIPPLRQRGAAQCSEEVEQIKNFINGPWKNMCLTFDDEETAQKGNKRIRSWMRTSGAEKFIEKTRIGSRIYIVRLDPAQIKARKGQQ